MDARKYFYSWKLNEEFMKRIETFTVWGSDRENARARNALFVTKDGEVYAIGELVSKCYKKTADTSTDFEPVLLEPLCHKQIKKFTITCNHVFICTEEGEVLGFGRYKYKKEIGYNLPNKVSQLNGIHVVDIAAGLHDDALLVLSDKGQIFHWVLMQSRAFLLNIILSAWRSKPINVFSGSRLSHFFALLENGKVLKVTRHRQDLLTYQNAEDNDRCKIKKLACGYSHLLLLDEDGRLFVFGHNKDGQLGLGQSMADTEQLVHNTFFTEKIIDIAATPSCSLSVAMTETGKVYMWGNCRGVIIFEPILTSCSSLQEVFFHYSVPFVTYKPMKMDELTPVVHEPIAPLELTNEIKQIDCSCKMTNGQDSLTDAFKKSFEDLVISVDKFCDLLIVVEGKTIPVHKTVLALRSEYFAEMFQHQQSSIEQIPKQKTVLEIEEGDFKSYKMFLKYIYTDQIENTLSSDEVLELLFLANKYRVKKLAEHCTSSIQPIITIDNIIPVYESVNAAMGKDTKMKNTLEKLKESCIVFTMKNEIAVIRSEGFKNLNSDLAKDLMVEVCERRSLNHIE